MTLIKCPECHHEMSSTAAFCGYCGRIRRRRNASNDGFSIIMIILFLFLSIGAIALYATGHKHILVQMLHGNFDFSPSATKPAMTEAEQRKNAWIQKSMQIAQSQLAGGAHATFQNVYFNAVPSGDTPVRVICGEVASAATNGTFQKFISSADTGRTAFEKRDAAFASLWNGLCVKK